MKMSTDSFRAGNPPSVSELGIHSIYCSISWLQVLRLNAAEWLYFNNSDELYFNSNIDDVYNVYKDPLCRGNDKRKWVHSYLL